jgi:biopolymer transport protein ExbD
MDAGPKKDGPSSEINVTPLVDVCLVLLIIFMVMTPKNVPEVSVRVPPETKNPPKVKESDTLVIGLNKEGAVTLNHNPINSREQLGEKIAGLLENRPKKVVFIDFDDDAVYGDAVDVIDLARRNGAAVIGVMKKKDKDYVTPDTL